MNIYHAKPGTNGTRSAGFRRVQFDIDGDPRLDMTEELDLNPQFKTVTTKVLVGDVELPKPEPELTIAEAIVIDNPGLPTGKKEESLNSSYQVLQAAVKTSKATSNKLQWTKVAGADGYVVFGNKANTKKQTYGYEVLSVLEDGKTASYTHIGLAKATYYKYIVQAYKLVDGKPQVVATSKTIYAATKNTKCANTKSLKVNKSKITLAKKGKTFKLKVTEKKTGKKMQKYRKIAFESGNPAIATVSNKGVIKAKKKGNCTIYVYSQNGICKKISVKVKK